MATTTNYGWTTPDDTALVKDGAAAIRSLGTSVDTTTKNLNPETTLGDISYRSSTANVNTRLPLGTAGQVLKVNAGATAPEWATDASGMTNPMTTTGDTIYSSSGSTPARLGIGTTGQILTVAGGVPSWATPASSGGMTLLSTTDLTGGATVTISSISQSYTDLQIEVFNVNMQNSVTFMAIEPNSTNNITQNQYVANSTAGADFNSRLHLARNGNLFDSQTTNAWTIRISNYASTTGRKPFSVEGAWWNGNTDTWRAIINGGIINTTSAITELKFANQSGDFSAGKVLIYGVK